MSIKFEIDSSQVDALIADINEAIGKSKDKAQEALRETATELRFRVYARMPRDSLRASQAWGVQPAPTRRYISRTGKVNPGSSADGIFRFEDDGLTHEQGTTVPYVEELNAGSSMQAPAGFIDAEADKAILYFAEAWIKRIAGLI